jgi:L-cysteate sulfo-lyase
LFYAGVLIICIWTSMKRINLATWPTPLEPAPRLAVALGLDAGDLWIKRDDLTGLGGGGNKVRKLEYTCAAALAVGATTFVTTGAAQSNHARLTAAAARRLGVEVVLVLSGRAPSHPSGNLAIDGLLDATVIWAGDVDDNALDSIAAQEVERLDGEGRKAVHIPFGGSNAVAVQGYADCGVELERQLPGFAYIFTAVGSGGTMAGLVHSLGSNRVRGVDTGAVANAEARVLRLLEEHSWHAFLDTLDIRGDQVGAGYQQLADGARAALALCAREGGIVLDPVYTGRAFAGLMAAVREGSVRRGERTVFLHSGGLPGLFGHTEALAFARSRY